MRKMFHECRLVHADLSEYNLILHEGRLYIIDVSQSVEHDHPHAFDFLRADLKNVEEFFSRRGVHVLGLRRSFEFVTREKFSSEQGEGSANGDEDAEAVLRQWMQEVPTSSAQEDDGVENVQEGDRKNVDNAAQEDAVFMHSYIPRTLNEVYDPERDVDALTRGEGKNLIYADTIGLVEPSMQKVSLEDDAADQKKVSVVRFADNEPGSVPERDGEGHDRDGESSSEEDGSEEEEESEEGNEHQSDRKPRGHRHEDKEAKKERKKAVKEEQREKRKTKMKKSEKKKRMKASRH